MKLMHFFLLLVGLWSLCSCNNPKKEILIYFQNNYFDDGPLTWPEFNNYEELPDEAIRKLEDISLASEDFKYLERNLLNIAEKSIINKLKNSINGYDENIYIIINQKDSIYFNKDNKFFSKDDSFIREDKKIAEYVRSIIRYDSYFSEEKKGNSVYSKVKINTGEIQLKQ